MRSPAAVAAAVSVALHVALAALVRAPAPRPAEPRAPAPSEVILEVSLAPEPEPEPTPESMPASELVPAPVPARVSAPETPPSAAPPPGRGDGAAATAGSRPETAVPPSGAASSFGLAMRRPGRSRAGLDLSWRGAAVGAGAGAPTPGAAALRGLGGRGPRPERPAPLAEDRAGYSARVEDDGRVVFRDQPNVQLDGLGGSFDLTDGVMRALGQDPYSAGKLRFLDRTRAQRVAIARGARERDRRDALRRLPAQLAAIWRAPELPVAQRKQILFSLWDECAEEGAPELVAAGARARATIVAFIRRHLPAGSAHAYSAAELEALNRSRSSRAPFAPYVRH